MTATAIDFETTGSVPGHKNQPWQIGLAPLGDDGAPAPASLFETLINVGARPFNKHAPGRHAQLRYELSRAPTMPRLLPEILPRLSGRYLIAHNAGTERAMLAAAAPLHKFGPWIDTLALSRAAWRGLDSYALEALCVRFKLDAALARLCPARAPHDALYDACACALLLQHILRQPGWSHLTAADLAEIS